MTKFYINFSDVEGWEQNRNKSNWFHSLFTYNKMKLVAKQQITYILNTHKIDKHFKMEYFASEYNINIYFKIHNP